MQFCSSPQINGVKNLCRKWKHSYAIMCLIKNISKYLHWSTESVWPHARSWNLWKALELSTLFSFQVLPEHTPALQCLKSTDITEKLFWKLCVAYLFHWSLNTSNGTQAKNQLQHTLQTYSATPLIPYFFISGGTNCTGKKWKAGYHSVLCKQKTYPQVSPQVCCSKWDGNRFIMSFVSLVFSTVFSFCNTNERILSPILLFWWVQWNRETLWQAIFLISTWN